MRRGAAAEGVVSATAADDARMVTIMIAPLGRGIEEMAALSRLANDYALARIKIEETAASLDLWRERASVSGARIAEAESRLAMNAADHVLIESTIAKCSRLRSRNRFAELGPLLAVVGPFDAWLVAIGSADNLRMIAASTTFVPVPHLEATGAIAKAVRRQETVMRNSALAGHPACEEDRVFGRYPWYLCAPFPGGAIALAASREIDSAITRRLEQVLLRLDPLLERWLAEGEVNRLQRLVRTLGVRMFSAIDSERQRIARDLHDHQAQLLAAARIALEADPAEARGILKQLDDVLRLRVRELRPATLGRADLREALRHEIRRLSDAGIKARVLYPAKARMLSRPVQQLCYQVVREAFSNVIRHADATRVAIAVEKSDGLARLRIDDNGKGLRTPRNKAEAATSPGMGLTGLAERLELMGGRLRIERLDNITRLTAEIPEL
jgi:signal transduction histidine kinase